MSTPLEHQADLPAAPVAPHGPPDKAQPQPTPVAYEEVVLTEEAAAILDELHRAATAAPKKAPRRMAAGDPGTKAEAQQ
jgi:hypothetical protein